MISAPSTEPSTVPLPPDSATPPITAAAITYSSMSVPSELVPAFSRATATTDATVTITGQQQEQLERHSLDRNADQQRRLRVAADREHVAPEARAAHDEGSCTITTTPQISTGIGMPWASGLLPAAGRRSSSR